MKPLYRRNLFGMAVIAVMLVLTACGHQSPPSPPPDTLPYHLSSYQKSLIRQIQASGAQVIRQGGRLQIILPTDRFFQPQTTSLKPKKVYVVNRVAMLVNSYIVAYHHPRILVAGYTDRVFARRSRVELSRQYASVIAAYLWNEGVKQRWIQVKGYGAKHPVASAHSPKGAAYNRRVMIQVG